MIDCVGIAFMEIIEAILIGILFAYLIMGDKRPKRVKEKSKLCPICGEKSGQEARK